MDEIDRRIVETLLFNCRIPIRELAEEVDISVTAAHRRVQTMTEKGIIHAFVSGVQYTVLDTVTGTVYCEAARPMTEQDCLDIGEHESVFRVWTTASDVLYISIVLRDESELEPVLDHIRKISGASDPRPFFFDMPVDRPESPPTLDRLDYRIIENLLLDARRPMKQIAADLDAPVKKVRRHLDRMIQEGSILLSLTLFQASTDNYGGFVRIQLEDERKAHSMAQQIEKQFGADLIFGLVLVIKNQPGLLLSGMIADSMPDLKSTLEGVRSVEGVRHVHLDPYFHDYIFETWRDDHVHRGARGELAGH